MTIPISLRVNGKAHECVVEADRTLLDVLRSELGQAGTKENCLEAECGVCTVLVDGAAVNSCVMLAAQAQGREILTIEGLASEGELHPLQQAFIDHGAVQCGYCIPGMIMSAYACLTENPDPTETEIREALAGNLCRCTGFQKIVAAVSSAARVMREGAADPAGSRA